MATKKKESAGVTSWDEFEAALLPAARGAARGRAADERALRDQLGDEEFEYLRKLATHAAMMRARAEPLGNVVLVPGIRGSSLASAEGSDTDLVWLNFARLALGRVERLRLNDEGGDGDFKVSAGEPPPPP